MQSQQGTSVLFFPGSVNRQLLQLMLRQHGVFLRLFRAAKRLHNATLRTTTQIICNTNDAVVREGRESRAAIRAANKKKTSPRMPSGRMWSVTSLGDGNAEGRCLCCCITSGIDSTTSTMSQCHPSPFVIPSFFSAIRGHKASHLPTHPPRFLPSIFSAIGFISTPIPR